jgi:hypothetical protein
MKTPKQLIKALTPTCLVAGVLMVTGSATTANAQALNPQISLRPLTPQEAKSLPGVQTASGLNTIAIGNAAYLDALVNISFPASNILSVVWTNTVKPVGSVAAVLTNSPLGESVPPYKITDRLTTKVAGRAMFIPDVEGQYSIRVTITTPTTTTNLTQNLTAGKYLGINGCALCHSGGLVAPDMYSEWIETKHAHAFTEAIDGKSTDHFASYCIKCHVVGFDSNTNSANGGFDDIAAQTGWTFPSTLTNGNWDAMPSALKNVSNVQCENCHGPGSQHAYSLGSTNLISVSMIAGSCAQCHDSLTYHPKTAEWNNSRHARATRSPSGPGRQACVRCHTASGFVEFVDTGNEVITNTVYEAITCAACHDPHNAENPHQLRAAYTYTLPEGTTVTNVGLGALCMECHHSRNGSAESNIANFQQNKPTWAGGVSFGPHDSTAGDMVEGVNGITYGKFIPSGAHSYVITNVCVGCHMQPVATTDPAFTKVGGHTFSMWYESVSGGVTNIIDKVDVCVKCHGPIEQFDMVRKDYNSDGVIEGIQTEVHHLLDELSKLLPNSTYRADGNYEADGQVKQITRTTVKTNWPTKFLNGAWNWMFVEVEGSSGIHNAPYAIGLLKASIADLTDDADHDGLSDKWEVANFGSISLTDANGDTDNDGVKNGLELSAGTNPTQRDSDGDGINDLAELQAGSDPLNGSDVPGFVVKIYGAAEVEFASQVGKKYQVQAVSDMTSSWLNVGAVTNGTGNNISMAVSTRLGGSQAYYRVLQVP